MTFRAKNYNYEDEEGRIVCVTEQAAGFVCGLGLGRLFSRLFLLLFSAFLFETLTGSVRVFCYNGGKENNREGTNYEK